MSRCLICSMILFSGFPRVSGDEPAHDRAGLWLDMFSPRERG